jgi:hypothetical protein
LAKGLCYRFIGVVWQGGLTGRKAAEDSSRVGAKIAIKILPRTAMKAGEYGQVTA